ncbi:hypothetical protein BDN72DRAFT_847389 [Pluteus cervinus]|uniref:Uncharacterized protein n=1 Tax=Pluteus cervinus TaxID=181527 RepID=A0ACD3ADA1_9AGAR|nr:hypothetical protein BDN72DRAFT_847389 [Pluteus cervinus]
MMEGVAHQQRVQRGRGSPFGSGDSGSRGRGQSRNKHWSATGDGTSRPASVNGHSSDGERWDRGGHRGSRGSRGGPRGAGARRFPNQSLRVVAQPIDHTEDHVEEVVEEHEEKEPESPEEREKFYQELVKARETERKKAIAEGKMDDPAVPKRLEDAISMVGTCRDMCPRFERYRRERENNLFEWEVIPGTKRVDHKRAVKMYERAAGDKTLPSDLRPPLVLKKTLDYLFHDLLPRGGFSQTFNFIRDRSRSVRNDFTMQHQTGPLAIECHDRCARFHILSIHHERNRTDFSIPLEEQQLMNTLQSLKEFYDDQRGRYESPTELEMRVYHRLIHIRDQRERKEDIPEHIFAHPVFKLTTEFRLHVQRKSAPISKTSALVVDGDGMQIFGRLASTLKEQGNSVMIYLVACILERHFGKDTIEGIEDIRKNLSDSDIIDGVIQEVGGGDAEDEHYDFHDESMHDDSGYGDDEEVEQSDTGYAIPPPVFPSATSWPTTSVGAPSSAFQPVTAPPAIPLAPAPVPSAFANLTATPNVFSNTPVFGAGFNVPPSSFFGPKPVSNTQPPAIISTPFNVPQTSIPIPVPQATPPAPPVTFASASKPTAPFFGQAPPTNLFLPSSHTPSPTKPISASTSPHIPQPSFPSTAAMHPPGVFPSPSPPQVQPASAVAQSSFQDFKPLPWTTTNTLDPKAPAFTPTLGATGIPSTSSTSSTSASSLPPQPSTSVPGPTFEAPSLLAPPVRKRKSSTPPVPRINTQSATNAFSNPPLATPQEPPQLQRPRPIALPETPTSTVPGRQPLTPFLKRNFETPPGTGKTGLLSPLTPSIASSSSFGYFGNAASPTKKAPSEPLLVPNDKGKAPEKRVDEEELARRALEFAQKSFPVKELFQHWRTRTLEQVAWKDACRQSEAYKVKIQRERNSQTPISDRKRRVSASTARSEPLERKRKKRISSTYQAPRTDEELARRLKENHEEHERRWARGTLLQTLRGHVKPQIKSPLLSSAWRTWISMNPDTDATAIWLEGKFDIPNSGSWESDLVFSIPVSQRDTSTLKERCPGLIIFECTPLGGIADEIERKYRILDDCSRLRDVINGLPPKRIFMPALLVIEWADNIQVEELEQDFNRLVKRYTDDGTLLGSGVLSTTAQDAEHKFASTLASLTLDVEGRLGRETTIRALVKVLEPSFGTFASEWLDNCVVYSEFDWALYARVLQVLITALNEICALVSNLFEVSPADLLPIFDTSDIHDSSSAYDHVGTWLANADLEQEADQILATLHSYSDMGKDFPSHILVDHLRDMTTTLTEQHLSPNGDTSIKYLIQEEAIDAAIDQYLAALESYRDELSLALSLRIRRSPKRRGYSEDTDSISQASKRRRFSSSALSESESMPPPSNAVSVASSPPGPTTNGINGFPSTHAHEALPESPTIPTASLAPSDATSTAGSVVTVSMLRQLTRDLRKKYSSSSLTIT